MRRHPGGCPFLVLALLCAPACADDDRNERELFLKLVHDYARAPEDDKGPALAALRRLRPRTDRVRKTHAVCLAAYGHIERAEAEHDRARTLLGDIEMGERSLATTGHEVEKAIAASNEAVETARLEIDRCTRLVDELRIRRE